MCVHTMALVFDRNPEFPVDPRFSSFGLKRKRKRGRPKNIGGALDRRVPRAADQGEEIEEHSPKFTNKRLSNKQVEQQEVEQQ